MAISGDLKAINLTELFQTLAQSEKQGTLSITDGPRTKHFIFTARGITLETSEDQLTGSLGDIMVRRVTGNWSEGTITESNAPSASGTVAQYSASCSTCQIDITSTAQDWVDGTLGNFGLQLIMDSGSLWYVGYYDRQSSASVRPRLIITYQD